MEVKMLHPWLFCHRDIVCLKLEQFLCKVCLFYWCFFVLRIFQSSVTEVNTFLLEADHAVGNEAAVQSTYKQPRRLPLVQ